jgi:hypothetical protein
MALTRLGPNQSVNLASNVTGTLPVANGGTAITSGFVNGVTESDQWRVTADFTPAGYVTANWERVDTNFAKIGTGMSESSGVFTFPSTGIWRLDWDTNGKYNGSSREIATRIAITTDDASYGYITEAGSFLSRTDSNTTYYSVHAQGIVDITNVSTHKVKFFHNTEDTVTADGATGENKIYATFLRLGDT